MNPSTPNPPVDRPPALAEAELPAIDREPIRGISGLVDAVLRRPRQLIHHLQHGAAGRLFVSLLAMSAVLAAGYGVIVGSFSGGIQWWAAPLKIAVGMVAAAGICLPSLYIFACLSGSRARLPEVTGALGGLLALMTLLLIGFAPVAWLFSQSTRSITLMGWLHLMFWAVSAGFGARFLFSAFGQFGLRTAVGIKVWIVVFVLVSLQMSTALRPLVGTSSTLLPVEKKFFAAHWIECVNSPR